MTKRKSKKKFLVSSSLKIDQFPPFILLVSVSVSSSKRQKEKERQKVEEIQKERKKEKSFGVFFSEN